MSLSPSTLTIVSLLILVSGASATTTNISNIQPSYIITLTPTPYTTSNGIEGVLMMTDFHYTNITNNCPIIEAPISIENMLYDIIRQTCQLVLYILSYKYIINTIFFIYNTYKRTIKYFDSFDSIDEKYELSTITINETIVDDNDDEDEDQNCTIYKTFKYEMPCYYSNNIKIDDIVYKGDCYIETNNDILFTNNYKPIKFTNPTYRQLLIIATLSPITEKNKIIDIDDISINSDKKYDNIQIITIRYS